MLFQVIGTDQRKNFYRPDEGRSESEKRRDLVPSILQPIPIQEGMKRPRILRPRNFKITKEKLHVND